jgi:putative thioredoxin
MRGAVDLSGLRDTATARTADTAPGGPDGGPTAPTATSTAAGDISAPPGSTSAGNIPASPGRSTSAGAPGIIIDVTEATFQTDVLERSLSTPVIIDFWAEWCEPCKQLSPLLEKLAVEGAGAWVLAKVDVDANPRIAQAFRVQGIPMVFAVVGGQPVNAFTGVIPESQLRLFINEALQAAGTEGVEIPEDPALLAADDALMAGDLDEAERAYRKILDERPADEVARAGLAQIDLFRRVEGVDPATALSAAGAAPDDVAAQSLAADVEVLSGQAELAYARLVDLVRRSAGDDRDQARTHLVALFAVAAPDDPAVVAARRSLANALY